MASGPLAFLGQSDQPLLRRSVLDDVTGNPLITSAPTGEVRQRASLLPLGVTDNGSYALAVPQMAFDAIDAMRAPQRAYSGDLQIWDPATGHTTEEAQGAAAGMAGLAMTGSMPFKAPAGALRMFGGRSAATADHAALEQAQSLAVSGADRRAIWDQTGWFQGADDKWRFEIPDAASALNNRPNVPASEAGFTHDALAASYPEMWGKTRVLIGTTPEQSGSYAWDSVHAFGPDAGAQRSVALHEYQHAIQGQEGFAPGGNPADPDLLAFPSVQRAARNGYAAKEQALYDLYQRHAGEVDSRNVEARRDFTPEQRRAIPPWETQDVPDEEQIVRFYSGGPAGLAGLPFLGRDR